ncbi:toxin CptA [Panacagrimonas perspica]|uniref:Toxin CptA n=1 Tax=Panacagrimonas perspica TaxID=381431 RepID=A0A4R7NY88_9GAMM|nr:protein YgfX [Panacagrimonas perspica]TDU25852.1 toxin CptA [Panacagrimonas perspica]THD02782.1 hypothetical protein B1810_12735 [Panacagrimonas perspica]
MSLALDVTLKPSARAHQLMFWLHVLPLALLPMAMETGAWMVGVAFAIGLSWVRVRRHAAFGFGPAAIVRIAVDPEGQWSIWNPAGTRLDVKLRHDSVLWSALQILNFRDADGRRRTRVLLGDEADPDALRRLRTQLAAGVQDPSDSKAAP